MPSLPKIAAAITGATFAAAVAFPPSRRQLTRTVGTAVDEIALRLEHQWSAHLILLTTEGKRTQLPRTAVLVGLEEEDGTVYALPWAPRAGWVANCEANADVVVDDRRQVRRARAEVVRGQPAAAVRQRYLERHFPGWLRQAVGRLGNGRDLPVVKLTFA